MYTYINTLHIFFYLELSKFIYLFFHALLGSMLEKHLLLTFYLFYIRVLLLLYILRDRLNTFAALLSLLILLSSATNLDFLDTRRRALRPFQYTTDCRAFRIKSCIFFVCFSFLFYIYVCKYLIFLLSFFKF